MRSKKQLVAALYLSALGFTQVLATASSNLELAVSSNIGYLPGEAILRVSDPAACSEINRKLDRSFRVKPSDFPYQGSIPVRIESVEKILKDVIRTPEARVGECVYKLTYWEKPLGTAIALAVEGAVFAQMQGNLGRVGVAVSRNAIIKQTPTDPIEPTPFERQYHLAAMRAEELWRARGIVGGTEVPVAFIDSGVEWTHKNLRRNISPSDVHNFYGPDGLPRDWHGTFVAGLACADGEDGGTSGIARRCRIISLKALDLVDILGHVQVQGTAASILAALYHVLNNYEGPLVVNMSIGWPADQPEIFQALKAGEEKFLVVVAAGNDTQTLAAYPAKYTRKLRNMLSVTSVNREGNLTSFGNIGEVDMATFGVDMVSTYLGDGYIMANGTSASAPLISGLAIMRWSELVRREVKRSPEYMRDSLIRSSYLDTRMAPWFFLRLQIDALRAWEAMEKDLVPYRARH